MKIICLFSLFFNCKQHTPTSKICTDEKVGFIVAIVASNQKQVDYPVIIFINLKRTSITRRYIIIIYKSLWHLSLI